MKHLFELFKALLGKCLAAGIDIPQASYEESMDEQIEDHTVSFKHRGIEWHINVSVNLDYFSLCKFNPAEGNHGTFTDYDKKDTFGECVNQFIEIARESL
ncbi:MAG: hypothetical protein GY938_13175 [Ketobacter sp.]|nr:hypothetical protein [Ketobacter sp.]